MPRNNLGQPEHIPETVRDLTATGYVEVGSLFDLGNNNDAFDLTNGHYRLLWVPQDPGLDPGIQQAVAKSPQTPGEPMIFDTSPVKDGFLSVIPNDTRPLKVLLKETVYATSYTRILRQRAEEFIEHLKQKGAPPILNLGNLAVSHHYLSEGRTRSVDDTFFTIVGPLDYVELSDSEMAPVTLIDIKKRKGK